MNDVPLLDSIKGVSKTSLSEGKVIQSTTCPMLKDYGCAFKRVGLGRSPYTSVVSPASLVEADETNQYPKDIRIAFGGIGPAFVRLNEIGDNLKGNHILEDMILKVTEYIPGDIAKSRSRREYRETVIRNFLPAGCSLTYRI